MKQHNCKDCPIKSKASLHLSEEELNILENNSAEVSFKKGEIIFKQNALSLNVAYLRTGVVKLHMHGPSKEKILKIIKAPTYLGIPTTFGDKINRFSATAIEDSSVCFIDSNLFRNFIFSNGKFAYEIIVELCKNELTDYERYASQTQKQIPGLVAETLLCMSDKIYENDTFNFPLTRGEMGDLIGTSRESVSRVLTDLSNEKIIEVNSNEITILKKDLLKQISEKG
ncbi:MAG TPA: Crp/Fnr family transcriptional regulator [Bacteroidales bacterium]|nr:Crp/Fnr family transcriptional regulator [Bacteroidales bacterium]HPS17799.1 Crp/Fnr family transcriptional regulator [Bacteroidales bacterium]